MNYLTTPIQHSVEPTTTNESQGSSQIDSSKYHTPAILHQTRISKHLTQQPSDWCDKVKGVTSVCTTAKPIYKMESQKFEISKFDFTEEKPAKMVTPTSKTCKQIPDAPLFKVVAWNPTRFDVEEDKMDTMEESIPAKCLR